MVLTPANIGYWAVLPISLIQGLRLRRTATRLPEAEGKKLGVEGRGKPLHLLALGDSIIAGVGTGTTERSLPVQFARALANRWSRTVHWRLHGVNGADITSLRQRLQDVDSRQGANMILISIGVNDVTGFCSEKRWRSQLEGLLVDLRKRWPGACVVFVGIPQMEHFPLLAWPLAFTLGRRAAELNYVSEIVLCTHTCTYHVPTRIDPDRHDFCEDGFHPGPDACKLWARGLLQRLEKAGCRSEMNRAGEMSTP